MCGVTLKTYVICYGIQAILYGHDIHHCGNLLPGITIISSKLPGIRCMWAVFRGHVFHTINIQPVVHVQLVDVAH